MTEDFFLLVRSFLEHLECLGNPFCFLVCECEIQTLPRGCLGKGHPLLPAEAARVLLRAMRASGARLMIGLLLVIAAPCGSATATIAEFCSHYRIWNDQTVRAHFSFEGWFSQVVQTPCRVVDCT